MRTLPIALILLLASCTPDEEEVPTQTTAVAAQAGDAEEEPLSVQRFEVTPEAVQSGQPVTASADLGSAKPGRELTLEWFGPDGWVVSRAVHDASQARVTFTTPATLFDKPGRYRAVLRSGTRLVAEDMVTVGSR